MEIGLGIFAGVVSNLVSLGFYGFILPFVLTFTLSFAAMMKTGLSSNAKIAGVFALCVAFMIPLISIFNKSVGEFFVLLFGSGAIILSFILVGLLIFAMLGMKVFK